MKILKAFLVVLIGFATFQFGGFLSTVVLAGQVGTGDSMQPTLSSDSYLLYVSFLVDMGMVERDSIVEIEVTTDEGIKKSVTKRVVGLPGETIEIVDGEFYINGQLQVPTYETIPDDGRHANQAAVTLGEDEYYVVGDNRSNSRDSRTVGPIKESQIKKLLVWHN